ncbi:Ras-like GTP-binding protein rhoA [Orchesella cincta]|uniref:Ras-like GTP-binding protein rhoA n=1 Tax=Orchesella cincta TaxID=48709 RepID=A0A1D2MEN9_ORCCI|nr:Ras-like GTP-binding protein rhoA [Orchesella cincta]
MLEELERPLCYIPLYIMHRQKNFIGDGNNKSKWLGVGEKSIKVDGRGYSLLTWDTFREENYLPARKLFYQEADCVIFCFAINNPSTLKSIIRVWLPEVKATNPTASFILVGTKSDKRVGRCVHECVSDDQARSARWKIGADAYVECSVKAQDNVAVVFQEAVRACVMKQQQTVLGCGANNNHNYSCKCNNDNSVNSANSNHNVSCKCNNDSNVTVNTTENQPSNCSIS